jgi:type I restriction enzyme S subunit
VGLEHITSGDIHLRNSANIEESTTFTKKFAKGDVLFGRRRAYLKKAAQADFDGICSGDITVFRAKSNLLLELLPFIVNNERFFDYAVKHSAGGLSPRVKYKDLANYEFLLPPKAEQARLAELLWAMDEVIEKEKGVLERLDNSYITFIEKELIDKDSKKLFFGEILDVVRGVGYKPEQLLNKYSEETCIVLRSNNIFQNKLNYDDIKIVPQSIVKSNQILKEGDFAICMSNGSKELVGKCAEYYEIGKNVSVGSFCAGLRPKNQNLVSLIRHLVNSESYRVAIKRTLTGSAINNLKPSDIEELFLRVDINNSSNVVPKLDSILNIKKNLDNSISSSQALLKSIINQVF